MQTATAAMATAGRLRRGMLTEYAAAAAAELMRNQGDYSAMLLQKVQFCAEDVYARGSSDKDAYAELVFPWRVTEGSLNGFKSAHGGALSTLADVFTTAHVRSLLAMHHDTTGIVATDSDEGDVEAALRAAVAAVPPVRTVSFDINFLNAIYVGKECVCVTRVVNAQPETNMLVEFAFEDARLSELVFTRGTHVLRLSG